MDKIKITEEYLEKYEDDFEFDKSEFDTDQDIEVRIPFEGYYTIKTKCKDPQVAMAAILQANDLVGILGLEGGDWEEEDVIEGDTYAVIIDKNINRKRR